MGIVEVAKKWRSLSQPKIWDHKSKHLATLMKIKRKITSKQAQSALL